MTQARTIAAATMIAGLVFLEFAALGGAQTAQAPANIKPQTAVQVGTGQVPWTIAINPSANAVPIGGCQAVYIDVKDESGKASARNPMGRLVGMQDFDWTATGAAVGIYDGANAWAVCACPAAIEGTTINVSATYPARSLPAAARVPGLAFRSYIELPVAAKRGSGNPAGCDAALKTTTVPSSVPGAALPTATGPLAAAGAASGAAAGAAAGAAPGAAAGAAPGAAAGAAPVVTPVNPSNFIATQTGEGVVVLSWRAVPNVTFYQVWGPGLPNTGMSVTGTSQVVTGITAGTQQWIVGSYYLPGPVSTAVEAFPKASLVVTSAAALAAVPPVPANLAATAPALSGRYRVVATGFRVLHQTKDELLGRDGQGDEVYGGFAVFHIDRRSSQLLDRDLRRTRVIGQAGHPGIGTEGRIKGGAASADGGFQQGDVFPPVPDPAKYSGAATSDTFPLKIWEGQLTNGQDAVIVLPTLWEWDGNQDGYAKWFALEVEHVAQIWGDQGVQAAVNGTQLAVITPPGTIETSFGTHINAGQAVLFALSAVGLFPAVGFTGNSYDRPIGAGMNGPGSITGIAAPVLPRRAIVLTREIVESTLAKLSTWVQPAPSLIAIPGSSPVFLPVPPPGTIGVQLFEAPLDDLQGMYLMYIQVERVP